ncbi:MAG: tRNA (N6-isopentenyl adenosine(37)-C2)-methylthiotransferase MiaB [Eubacteriaceae bacterium]|nr:tRNA (N6-isopentenyl adenosine(37)-C2)-methylthiotransferase MiaB [Eubacteriaceae bacterium]
MNENDSEKIAGMLMELGLSESNYTSADLVLFNTCSIRGNADEKFFGHLGAAKARKAKEPDMLIAVCGCFAQQDGAAEEIMSKYPVDIIFGTHNLSSLEELLTKRIETGKTQREILEDSDIEEGLPIKRSYAHKAFVTIMNGCDNYCSYCIVPFARGREKSREAANIITEIKDLAANGCKEVMLLGQNVNSYGIKSNFIERFSDLLLDVAVVKGIERIRFMTSHPKDFGVDIIEAINASNKICNSIHLPLQSGSSKILASMNRVYSKEWYLDLAANIRESIKGVSITTDIIVGFPGEEDWDFEQTMEVMDKCKFEGAFTFIFSPRKGTKAYNLDNVVPEHVIKERFNYLVAFQNNIMAQDSERYVGTSQEILVDGPSTKNMNILSGRTMSNKLVNFTGQAQAGETVFVKITEGKPSHLFGHIEERKWV